MSSAAQAFIAFLRCEATQSDERARSLRATAAAIEANNLEGACRPSGVHLSFLRLFMEGPASLFGIFFRTKTETQARYSHQAEEGAFGLYTVCSR